MQKVFFKEDSKEPEVSREEVEVSDQELKS
jgi:hypothetical protein